MEQNKRYSDMTYLQFLKDVLKIELTKEQEVLLELFEENKAKKVEYIHNYNTIDSYFEDGNIPQPTTISETLRNADLKYIKEQSNDDVSEDYNYRKQFRHAICQVKRNGTCADSGDLGELINK